MDTSRSEWKEDKDFTVDKERDLALKKNNNLLTSVRCSKKYPKDSQILALVGLAQELADISNKSSEKSNPK